MQAEALSVYSYVYLTINGQPQVVLLTDGL